MWKKSASIALLIVLVVEIAWLAFPQPIQASEFEMGYNVLINKQLTEEQLDSLVSELSGTKTVKLWLSPKLLNGSFSYWDLVIGKFSDAGVDVFLDPWLRMDEMEVQGDGINVLWNGERLESCPSIFEQETKDYILDICSDIGTHYGTERPDLGASISVVTVFNEPYWFLSCGRRGLPDRFYKWLIDEDFTRAPATYREQYQELAELFLECKDLIKENLDVPVVVEPSPPPMPPGTLELWKDSDISILHIYPENYQSLDWFFYKLIIEQARREGKPIWVTEWGYDAFCVLQGNWARVPPTEFIDEFTRTSKDWGVDKLFYFAFLFTDDIEGPCYSLYDMEEGHYVPRMVEPKEALDKAEEEYA